MENEKLPGASANRRLDHLPLSLRRASQPAEDRLGVPHCRAQPNALHVVTADRDDSLENRHEVSPPVRPGEALFTLYGKEGADMMALARQVADHIIVTAEQAPVQEPVISEIIV